MRARCYAAAIAALAAFSASAQVPTEAGLCARPGPAPAPSCIELAVYKRPALLPLCVSELEEVVRAIDEWEKCAADKLAERQAAEREALRRRAQEMRASRLQGIQTVLGVR